MSQKPILLFKSHVKTFTRKDGVVVEAHDTKVQAASKFAVKPFRHGGHQVTNDGKNHVILSDENVASKHASSMNHVAASGKSEHMASSVSAAADKHLDLSDIGHDAAGDDDESHDTGKAGVKAALESAYHAGAGGDHPHLREHRDKVVSEAAKHFAGFDSLKPENRDSADFRENSRSSIRTALQHAYAHGAVASDSIKSAPAAVQSVKAAAKPAETPAADASGIGPRRQKTLAGVAEQMMQLWGGRKARIEIELKGDRSLRNKAERDYVMSHVERLAGAGADASKTSKTDSGAKSLASVAEKHNKHFEQKALDWHTRAHEIPASDIPSGAPEFSHKEVYGHNGVTSPAGDDFSDEFKAKAPKHFIIKHPNGARHLVDTQGYDYARGIVPIERKPKD